MADSAGTIHVWDTATAKEVRRFPWPHGVGPDGGPPFLQLRVAASRNGVAVAAVGHIPVRNGESLRLGLRLWETASGQELFTSLFREWHPGSPRAPVVAPYPDAISGLAFSQDGAALALANGETIRLWDAARGKELRRFGGTGVKAETAAFCPDGRLLAALSEDGTLHLWEVATGTALPPVGGRHLPITCFLFSPNGRVLFTGCKDTTILAWDVAYLRERGHAKRLAAGELEALWRDLADKDAGRAYRALL